MKRVAFDAALLATTLAALAAAASRCPGQAPPPDRQVIYSADADRWMIEPWGGLAWYGRDIQGPRLQAAFHAPGAIAAGPDHLLYTIGDHMLQVPADGPALNLVSEQYRPGCADGPADLARLGGVGLMGSNRAIPDGRGGYFIADWGNQCIRRMSRDASGEWRLETAAGEPSVGPGWDQWRDGDLKTARFRAVSTILLDKAGNLIVLDSNRIRLVDFQAGTVATLNPDWGHKGYCYGFRDGPLNQAQFSWILIGAGDLDRENNALYIGDSFNKKARKVDLSTKTVTTVWDGKGGKLRDGPIEQARGGPTHVVDFDPYRRRLIVKEMDCQVLRVLDMDRQVINTWLGTTDTKRKDAIRAGRIPYPMKARDACLNYVQVMTIGPDELFVGPMNESSGGGLTSGVISIGRVYVSGEERP